MIQIVRTDTFEVVASCYLPEVGPKYGFAIIYEPELIACSKCDNKAYIEMHQKSGIACHRCARPVNRDVAVAIDAVFYHKGCLPLEELEG